MNRIAILALSSLSFCHSSLTFASIGYTQEELNALAALEKSSHLSAETRQQIKSQEQASQSYQQQMSQQAKAWQEKLNSNHLQGMIDIPEPTPNPHAVPVGVMAFVSLTMPESSLRALLKQSEIWQVPLVIRGVLPDGFPATATKIQSLLNGKNDKPIESGFAINPEWFHTFNITEVPTFVAVKPGRCLPKQPCGENDFDIVRGNISIPNALEHLARGDNIEVVKKVIQQKRN